MCGMTSQRSLLTTKQQKRLSTFSLRLRRMARTSLWISSIEVEMFSSFMILTATSHGTPSLSSVGHLARTTLAKAPWPTSSSSS